MTHLWRKRLSLKSPHAEMQRFPRSARLLNADDFQKVFKKSKRIHSRSFTIYVHVTSCNVSRLGLAISKKVLPRAVDRNRAKRLIRESFRKNRWRFFAYDCIFVARNELRGFSNAQLYKELDGVWDKLAKLSAT